MIDNQKHQAFQIHDYIRIIRRRWLWLAVFVPMALVGTFLGTSQVTPEYLATTTLQVELVANQIVDFDDTNTTSARLADYQWFYKTQVEILNSRTVKQGAIDQLRAKGIKEWDDSLNPIRAFGQNMQVMPTKDTRLIRIGYVHTDPEIASEIANTIAQIYMDENLRRKVEAMRRANKWLEDQAQEYLGRLRDSDRKLLDYKMENDLMAMEEKAGIYQKNFSDTYTSYNRTRLERVAAESEYRMLKGLADQRQFDPLIAYFNTETISRLKEQFNEVDRRYHALSERYLPKHPNMLELDTERNVLAKKLEEEVRQLITGKEATYNLLRGKESSLSNELDRVKGEAADLEAKMIKAKELTAMSERDERFFKALDERRTEIDLVGHLLRNNSNIEVIDQAIAPKQPFRPDLLTNLLLAGLFSLTVGLGLIFGAELLDTKFKSPKEVEEYLHAPLLGIVPKIGSEIKAEVSISGSYDTFVFDNPRSRVAECCRALRTNIVLGARDRQIRTLMVTSAAPEEGKSTLVLSLGITMAQANTRTVLIDTDLHKPRLHRVFGVEASTGYTSLYEGSASIEDVVFPTRIPNLFIVPAGPFRSNPSEMLGSERTDELIEELKKRFDMVIFDSPPCGAVTDAVVLSTKLDGVILVVKQHSTIKEAAAQAKQKITEVGGNLLGCVVNDIDMDSDRYGYGYYYYYYYYYGDENRRESRSGKSAA